MELEFHIQRNKEERGRPKKKEEEKVTKKEEEPKQSIDWIREEKRETNLEKRREK